MLHLPLLGQAQKLMKTEWWDAGIWTENQGNRKVPCGPVAILFKGYAGKLLFWLIIHASCLQHVERLCSIPVSGQLHSISGNCGTSTPQLAAPRKCKPSKCSDCTQAFRCLGVKQDMLLLSPTVLSCIFLLVTGKTNSLTVIAEFSMQHVLFMTPRCSSLLRCCADAASP